MRDEEVRDELSEEEIERILYGDKKEKKSKGKGKKIVKGLVISGLMATLITGGIHLDRHTNVFNGKKANTTKQEQTVNNSNVNNNVNNATNITNSNGTSSPITYIDSKNSSESEYHQTMQGVANRSETSDKIIQSLEPDKYVDYTKEQIFDTLSDNARIANSSMFEISEFINGRTLTGKGYYYNFERNFSVGSADYNMLKVFSDLRNELITAAYKDKDISKTKQKLSDIYSLFAKVVHLDKTISYDGVMLDYSGLTSMGKATLLEIGSAFFAINYNDFQLHIDNKTLSKETIFNDAVEELEGNLIPSLINKGYTR